MGTRCPAAGRRMRSSACCRCGGFWGSRCSCGRCWSPPLLGAMVLGRWRVLAPRRFGMFLLLIAWMIASGFEVQGGQRLLAWGWRLSFFICGRNPLLCTSTTCRGGGLPTRVDRELAGGLLGDRGDGRLARRGAARRSAQEPAEYVLPQFGAQQPVRVRARAPAVRRGADFLGFPIGRPETFFAYTNALGVGVRDPDAVCDRGGDDCRPEPGAASLAMLACSPPWCRWSSRSTAASGCRWESGIMYAAVRLGANRDFRLVRAIVGRYVCIVVLLVATPLGGLATSRFSHQTGDTGRLQRDQAATEQVLDHPVLGYGATDAEHRRRPELDRHRVRSVPAGVLPRHPRRWRCSSSGSPTPLCDLPDTGILMHSGRTW